MSSRLRQADQFPRDDRGIAAVEFAILGIVLIMLVVGVMEVARVVWVLQTLDRATQETARYQYGAVVSNAALQTKLQDNLTAYGLGGSVGSCAAPTAANQTNACVKAETVAGAPYLTIQAQYLWESMIPLVPSTVTLTRMSRVPQ